MFHFVSCQYTIVPAVLMSKNRELHTSIKSAFQIHSFGWQTRFSFPRRVFLEWHCQCPSAECCSPLRPADQGTGLSCKDHGACVMTAGTGRTCSLVPVDLAEAEESAFYSSS
eukprot:190009-Amphidinium_carterae.2